MNKQVIKSNKECFEWWLSTDEAVWVKTSNSLWVLQHPEWDCVECTYIENDKYSKFRKAHADGSIVETDIGNTGVWVAINNSEYFQDRGYTAELQHYRIRPEFIVGDWVRGTTSGKAYRYELGMLGVIRWEPQEGDIVIYWANGHEAKHISQYVPFMDWDNIIPYIGQDYKDMK